MLILYVGSNPTEALENLPQVITDIERRNYISYYDTEGLLKSKQVVAKVAAYFENFGEDRATLVFLQPRNAYGQIYTGNGGVIFDRIVIKVEQEIKVALRAHVSKIYV